MVHIVDVAFHLRDQLALPVGRAAGFFEILTKFPNPLDARGEFEVLVQREAQRHRCSIRDGRRFVISNKCRAG